MYDGRIIRRVNEFGGVEPHVEFIWLAYDVCVWSAVWRFVHALNYN